MSSNDEIKTLIEARKYPDLLKRVQSTFIDGILTFIFIGLLVTCANSLVPGNTNAIIAAIILGASYEPVTVWYDRSIGQRITGIKVQNINPRKRVNILGSYLRFVCKNLLGWVSFLIMFNNKERRAIHDFLGCTVVVIHSDSI